MKIYYLPVNQETADYLQRLGYDVDTRHSVIDRLLTNHREDTDASVLEGIPFKKYHEELEHAVIAYEEAKNRFTSELSVLVGEKEGKEDVAFDWRIEDFNSLQVKIIIRDEENGSGVSCGSCRKEDA